MSWRTARILAVAALSLAACSSDDGAAESTTAVTAVTTVTDEPSPVVTGANTLPPQSTVDDQSIGPPTQDEIGPPPEFRACNLSASFEAGDLLGLKGTYQAEADRSGILVCAMMSPDDQRLGSIHLVTAEADPLPAAAFADLVATVGALPVDGFGDDAVWVDSVLNVLIGDEMLTLQLFPQTALDDEALRTATMQWAELVVPRYVPPAAAP